MREEAETLDGDSARGRGNKSYKTLEIGPPLFPRFFLEVVSPVSGCYKF
jgi:hypothetical protein